MLEVGDHGLPEGLDVVVLELVVETEVHRGREGLETLGVGAERAEGAELSAGVGGAVAHLEFGDLLVVVDLLLEVEIKHNLEGSIIFANLQLGGGSIVLFSYLSYRFRPNFLLPHPPPQPNLIFPTPHQPFCEVDSTTYSKIFITILPSSPQNHPFPLLRPSHAGSKPPLAPFRKLLM